MKKYTNPVQVLYDEATSIENIHGRAKVDKSADYVNDCVRFSELVINKKVKVSIMEDFFKSKDRLKLYNEGKDKKEQLSYNEYKFIERMLGLE